MQRRDSDICRAGCTHLPSRAAAEAPRQSPFATIDACNRIQLATPSWRGKPFTVAGGGAGSGTADI